MLKKIVLFTILNIAFLLIPQSYAQGGDNKNEAKELVLQLTTFWDANEYQQAKNLIDSKLSGKPGWIPAVLLKSAYFRNIDVDPNAALTILETIDSTISAFDPNQYRDFLAFYNLYKFGVENDPIDFTEQQKAARRVLAHDLYKYFPGSEIVSVYYLCMPEEPNNWYDTNWEDRKKITIHNTFVDSNLVDFSLYVRIDSDPNIGAHAQANGNDIVFTLADGLTQIPYEKEAFSITSGNATGHFWVKVPTINSSTTTDIYIYYGDPNASDGQNVSGVWDNGQVGVWHLSETSGDAKDSTSNGYDLSLSGPEQNQAGKIGKAYDFVSTNSDHGQIEAQFITAYPITLMAWVNPDSITQGDYYLSVWLGDKDLTNSYWAIVLNYSGNGKVGAYHNNLIPSIAYSSKTLTAGNWHQVVAVFNTSSDRRCYVDGGDKGTSTYYSGSSNYPDRFSIGYAGDSTPGYYFDGLLDEVRVYNRALSDAEVKFTYYNQNESDNEITWHTEETRQIE